MPKYCGTAGQPSRGLAPHSSEWSGKPTSLRPPESTPSPREHTSHTHLVHLPEERDIHSLGGLSLRCPSQSIPT